MLLKPCTRSKTTHPEVTLRSKTKVKNDTSQGQTKERPSQDKVKNDTSEVKPKSNLNTNLERKSSSRILRLIWDSAIVMNWKHEVHEKGPTAGRKSLQKPIHRCSRQSQCWSTCSKGQVQPPEKVHQHK